MYRNIRKLSTLILLFATLLSVPRRNEGASSYKFVLIGSSFDVNCQQSDNTAAVSLRRGIKVLPVDGVKIEQHGQTFTIHKVNENDTGDLQCQASLPGRPTEFVLFGTVYPAQAQNSNPTIVVLPLKETVVVGQSVTFKCEAVGSKILSVRWYKDTKEVSQSLQTKSVNGNLHKNILKLTNVGTGRRGKYECRVKTIEDFYVSYWPERVELKVRDFKFLGASRDYIFAVVGSRLKINCRTSDRNASVSLWVQKRGRSPTPVVPDGVKIVQKGPRFTVHKTTIVDNGIYKCKARNGQGRTIEMDMGHFIAFQGGYKNPRAHVFPYAKTLYLGENFNFTCKALGDVISFTWLKNGTAVPRSHVSVVPARDYQGFKLHEAYLMIKGARKSDEAMYTCRLASGLQPGYSHGSSVSLTVQECRKPNGRFADPTNKQGFIQCKNGNAERKVCLPQGQHWNDTRKLCEFPASTTAPTTPFLRWTGQNYERYEPAPYKGPFSFNCSLSDSTLAVQLMKSSRRKSTILPVKVNGKMVTPREQVFTMYNLEKSDDGKYYCRAVGIADRVLTELHVDIHLTTTVSVRIYPRQLKRPLEYTDNVTIVCKSENRGDVTWYKANTTNNVLIKITRGTRLTDSQRNGYILKDNALTLHWVTKDDAGLYMCRKNNSVGAMANKTILVSVRDPIRPSIRDHKPNLSTSEKSLLTITCRVSGSPKPDVTWYRGGTLVAVCRGGQVPHCTSKTPRKYEGSWRSRDSELTIYKPVYPADNNVFKCKVKNLAGKDEASTMVSVFVTPEIEKMNGLSEVLVTIGISESYSLECKIRRGNPAPKVIWKYQRWPCSNTDRKCAPYRDNWRSVISAYGKVMNGSLVIPRESDNTAFYMCTVKNQEGNDSLVYEVHRTVIDSKLLEIKGGAFKEYDEHQDVNLSCMGRDVFDSPPYWLDNNGRRIINTSRVYITVQSRPLQHTTHLHIMNAILNDSGIYECKARKKDTKIIEVINTRVSLQILPVSSPRAELDNQSGNESNTVTLQCNVTGHPMPTVRWFKNGRLLDVLLSLPSTDDCSLRQNGLYDLERKKQGRQTSHQHTLVVCHAKYNDGGTYKCHARNKLGSATAQGNLNIFARPTISIDDPGQRQIGDKLMVECRATGNPKPNVRWMKINKIDEKQVSVGENSVWSKGRKTLYIESLSKEDFGKYLCLARNFLGEETKNYVLASPPISGKIYVNEDSGIISQPALIAIAVSAGFVIFLLLVIIVVLYRRKKMYGGFYIFTLPPLEDYIKKLDPGKPLLEQTHKLPWNAEWEFPRDRVNLGKVIGCGAFGQVYLADALGIVAFDPRGSMKGKGRRRSRFGSTRSQYQSNKKLTVVACKTLKENATDIEYRDLLSELKILMHIGEHKNIVNLLGACTKGREGDIWVIIEYCPYGNLLDFLRKRREIYEAKWAPATEKPDEVFTMTDLLITSFQVVKAMQFLASRRCVHRDLAARNVLVGENYIMKVADFGLARDIYKDEHYVKTTAGLLPVKWMAIEALVDQVYTHKSDVWSFGVLLWEIFTLGGSPYPGLPANEVYQYLMEGRRMDQPHDCADEIYRLMLSCWEHDPNQRPSFTDLLETIGKILEETTTETGEGYLDLENDGDVNENNPEYLEPCEINSHLSPETPLEDKNCPLPPIPYEEIELKEIPNKVAHLSDSDNKKAFVLGEPRKGKMKPQRIDSEIEKVRKDTREREGAKKSESSNSGASVDGEFISEKEQRDDDEEKDVCERNSAVFDSPPPYINTRPYNNIDDIHNYANDVALKRQRAFRPREQSARYIDA